MAPNGAVYLDLFGPPGSASAGSGSSIPADASGSALNISRDGDTVVGYLDNGFYTRNHAFRWTEATGLVDLGTLDPPNNASRSSYATDVSSDGSVVVGYSNVAGFGEHAFRWTEGGGMVDLGVGDSIDNPGSRAYGASGDGNIVGGDSNFQRGSSSKREAARWTTGGGIESLGTLINYGTSTASAVTAEGSVIVGQATADVGGGSIRPRAMRWTQAGGIQSLGALPGHLSSAATGVSDDGSIVVGISSPYPSLDNTSNPGGTFAFSTDTRAFYWTAATGMQDLTQLMADAGVDMTGITVVAATGISPDGMWIGGAAVTPTTPLYETAPVVASLTATLSSQPGDYNGDGSVDAADYVVWRDHLGTSFDLGGNGDESGPSAGVVDQADYTLWKAHFSDASGSGSAAPAVVPEPATKTLMFTGLFGLLVSRRSKKGSELNGINISVTRG